MERRPRLFRCENGDDSTWRLTNVATVRGRATYHQGMDLQRALVYAADQRNTLLTTLRRDGRPPSDTRAAQGHGHRARRDF